MWLFGIGAFERLANCPFVYMGMWLFVAFEYSFGHLGMWLFGHLGKWLFGHLGVWLFVPLVIWRLFIWAYVHLAI